MKDWENPVKILQNINNILEVIIVGINKEKIDITSKDKIKYLLLILFIKDKENIPPNVVPKNDMPPKEPSSLSVILKEYLISFVEAERAPWSKFNRHNSSII